MKGIKSISGLAAVVLVILMAVSPVSASDFVYQGEFGLNLAVGDVVAYETTEYSRTDDPFGTTEENNTTYMKVNVTGIFNITNGYNITSKNWYSNTSADPEKSEGWVNETDSSYIFNRSASTWQYNLPSTLTCNDLNVTIVEAMLYEFIAFSSMPENSSDTTYYIHDYNRSSSVTFKNETELHYELNEYINYTEVYAGTSSEAQPLQTSTSEIEVLYTIKYMMKIDRDSKLIYYKRIEMNSTFREGTFYSTTYGWRKTVAYYRRITVNTGDSTDYVSSFYTVPGYMWEIVLGSVILCAAVTPLFLKKFRRLRVSEP